METSAGGGSARTTLLAKNDLMRILDREQKLGLLRRILNNAYPVAYGAQHIKETKTPQTPHTTATAQGKPAPQGRQDADPRTNASKLALR